MTSLDVDFLTLRNVTAYNPNGTPVPAGTIQIISSNGQVTYGNTLSTLTVSSITVEEHFVSTISTYNLNVANTINTGYNGITFNAGAGGVPSVLSTVGSGLYFNGHQINTGGPASSYWAEDGNRIVNSNTNDAVSTTKNLIVGNGLSVTTGGAVINGLLTTNNGTSTIGNMDITGYLSTHNNTFIGGNLSTTGTAAINNLLTLNNGLNITSGGATITGNQLLYTCSNPTNLEALKVELTGANLCVTRKGTSDTCIYNGSGGNLILSTNQTVSTISNADITGYLSTHNTLTVANGGANINGITNIGTSGNGITVSGNGYLGIFNTNPSYQFDCTGAARITSNLSSLGNIITLGYHNLNGSLNTNSNINITNSNANTDSNAIIFNKSNGGLDTSSDTELGYIYFNGTNTSNTFSNSALIYALQDGPAGSNYVPGKIQFHTTTNTAGTPPLRMIINSQGNVGIGTATPAIDALLHVAGNISTVGNQIITGYLSTNTINMTLGALTGVSSINGYPYATGEDTWWNSCGNNNISTVNTGNVGIGTSTPNVKLQVNGTFQTITDLEIQPFKSNTTGNYLYVGAGDSGNNVRIGAFNNGSTNLCLQTSAQSNGGHHAGGNVGIGILNPQALLDINGGATISYPYIFTVNNTDTNGRATITVPSGATNMYFKMVGSGGGGSTAGSGGYINGSINVSNFVGKTVTIQVGKLKYGPPSTASFISFINDTTLMVIAGSGGNIGSNGGNGGNGGGGIFTSGIANGTDGTYGDNSGGGGGSATGGAGGPNGGNAGTTYNNTYTDSAGGAGGTSDGCVGGNGGNGYSGGGGGGAQSIEVVGCDSGGGGGGSSYINTSYVSVSESYNGGDFSNTNILTNYGRNNQNGYVFISFGIPSLKTSSDILCEGNLISNGPIISLNNLLYNQIITVSGISILSGLINNHSIAGYVRVVILAIGGGGGGSGGANIGGYYGGGGGGSGQEVNATYYLPVNASLNITVGNGGSGGTSGTPKGISGENTTITSSTNSNVNILCIGGQGGGSNNINFDFGGSGYYGGGCGGGVDNTEIGDVGSSYIYYPVRTGHNRYQSDGSTSYISGGNGDGPQGNGGTGGDAGGDGNTAGGGGGGSSSLAIGGNGGTNTDGTNGTYGSGGGGGGTSNAINYNGGAGGKGCVQLQIFAI